MNTQQTVVNAPMEVVFTHLGRVKLDPCILEGWFSFERMRGGTQITYTSLADEECSLRGVTSALLSSMAQQNIPPGRRPEP